MPKYVDGYLMPIPRKNVREYQKVARKAGKIWKKYGALEYFECVGDDLNSKFAMVKFPKVAKAKPGETVVFSFIVYRSKAHRDRVNAKVMADPYMQSMSPEQPVPIDVKRMAFGGFTAIVEA